MLRQRVITALILAPVAVLLVAGLPQHLIWYPLAPVFGLAAWEWARMARIPGAVGRVAVGIAVTAAVALLLPVLAARGLAVPYASAGVLGWCAIALWLRHAGFGGVDSQGLRTLKLVIGVAVILVAALALCTLFAGAAGRGWLLALLLVIWGADTGAYFTGKQFGRRKLAPSISPGKTWEGVYGGLVVVILVCVVAGTIAGLSGPQRAGLVLVGLASAVLSIVGDLFASLLKRQAGMKDSSRLLPGHGGVVDRIDSLLAAAPVFLVGLAVLGINR